MSRQISLLTAVSVAAVFLLTGCTQIEREGISPIPQNTPASWEMNPYGEGVFR